MKTNLNGAPELQRMILMYCLESPSAKLIQKLKQNVNQNGIQPWISKSCVWYSMMNTILKSRFKNTYIQKARNTFTSFIVYRELELTRIGDPIMKEALEHEFHGLKKMQFDFVYRELTLKEQHGTPSGVCIRKHLEFMKLRGLELRENDTWWSMFVCLRGRIAEKYGNPVLILPPAVDIDFCKIWDEYNSMGLVFKYY